MKTLDADAGSSAGWARDLAETVRSSDRVFALSDGTLLVLVPEDTQSLGRLQRRLAAQLRAIAGEPNLELKTSQVVYPGRHDSADLLVADALSELKSLTQ
jgi:hypothetical protein